MHYALLVITCAIVMVAGAAEDRQGRVIMQQLKSHATVSGVKYQLCEKSGVKGACLPSTICNQQGKFIGFCGNTETYCCKVVKTCGQRTKSHHAIFRNPNYPGRDKEARVCTFEMDIGKEVCGVRLNMDFFELASYQSGVCIQDTLTVLGSKSENYTTTPVCGNMTNWATNFFVSEGSRITLAMVLQGKPSHKFSIRVTQLPCSQITTFISPTYSGLRNTSAMSYTPTTTPAPTEAPESTTTDIPTETPMTDIPTDVPTIIPPVVESTSKPPAAGTTSKPPAAGTEKPKPTTLKPGKIPVPPEHDKVVVKAPEEQDTELALEGVNSVPTISAFKNAFELKVNDRCWQYEDESDTGFRIIGGDYANINEYPWQVALVYKSKFFCGGSIINSRFIITASHCIFASFSKGFDDIIVSMGDHDLSTRNETKHTIGKVKSIHWNLFYNPHTTHNDIAVVELKEPIKFDYSKSAVRLPSDLDELYVDANATVTGWGRFNAKRKKTSAVLKEYTGPLLDSKKCVAAWNKFPGISADLQQHICLDVTLGTPCHGDSGGPLVVCSAGHCTLVGVVSFGFPLCTNVGLPAVFARITHYKPWLDMVTHPLEVLHV